MLPVAPFDAAKSIFAGLSVIQLKLAPVISGVAAEADTDVITKAGHTLVNGQILQFVSGTGFTGLVAGTNYFVRDANQGAGTFKLAATKTGAAIDITLDGTVGIFQPVHVFEVAKLEDDPSQSVKELKRPDAQGRLRSVRTVETEVMEKFTFDLQELKRVLELFDGKMRGRKEGTCTLWIPDPDDATGKVALKSQDDFAVVVSRDGKITYGNSEFSQTVIKIESQEAADISWTADGDA